MGWLFFGYTPYSVPFQAPPMQILSNMPDTTARRDVSSPLPHGSAIVQGLMPLLHRQDFGC